MSLLPWAEGPFELILHGEIHFRNGDDFDRRMALISFDNAIEVAITTYLNLHPIQRQNRSYEKEKVAMWINNFHTKLDFLECECSSRGIELVVERTHFVWYHDLRGKQYHEGSPSTPNLRELKSVREAAIWVFSTLYDVPDAETILEGRIAALTTPSDKPDRDPTYDKVLDNAYGLIEIGDDLYYASELLYGYDPSTYSELALSLMDGRKQHLDMSS